MESIKDFLKENRKLCIVISNVIICIIFVLSIILIALYSKQKNIINGLDYVEKKDIDYKVMLKENNFYSENYAEKDNQYISKLISSIDTKFKYNFNINEEYDYEYKYSVIADVNVSDNSTKKSLYSYQENILDEQTGESNNELNIDQNISIDYNKYNDKINEFISVYGLSNVTSELNIHLNVKINGKTEKFSKESDVMSITIPLTKDTVSIDTNYATSGLNGTMVLENKFPKEKIFLVSGIVLAILDVILLVGSIVYRKISETPEDKYDIELKKIINNYESYISEVEDDFSMEGYQILRVNKFIDLLEIRDTMRIPIIMIQKKEQKITYFVIPTDGKILYFFSIGVNQYMLGDGKHSKINENNTEEFSEINYNIPKENKEEKDEVKL